MQIWPAASNAASASVKGQFEDTLVLSAPLGRMVGPQARSFVLSSRARCGEYSAVIRVEIR